jgi:hypothetical protein
MMKEREDISLVNADGKTSVLTAGDIDWIHGQRRGVILDTTAKEKVREEKLTEAMDEWERDHERSV